MGKKSMPFLWASSLFAVVTFSLVSWAAPRSSESLRNQVLNQILNRNFAGVRSLIERNRQLNLLAPIGPHGNSLIWLALHPEDAVQESGIEEFSESFVDFTSEQKALIELLIERDPRILSQPKDGFGLPALGVALLGYQAIYNQRGPELAQKYLEKIEFLISKGANLETPIATPDGISAPLPFVLANSISPMPFRSLEYLARAGHFDFSKSYKWTDIGMGGRPQERDTSLGDYLLGLARNPHRVADNELRTLKRVIQAAIQKGYSLFDIGSGDQSPFVVTMISRVTAQRESINFRFNEQQRADHALWSQRAFKLLNMYADLGWNPAQPIPYRIPSGEVLPRHTLTLALNGLDFDLALFLLDRGAQLEHLPPELTGQSIYNATKLRHFKWLNRLAPDAEQMEALLNFGIVVSPEQNLVTTPLAAAMQSLIVDRNLPATVAWIQQLVTRGMKIPFSASDAETFTDMLPEISSAQSLLANGIHPSLHFEYQFLLRQLTDYLDSREFQAFYGKSGDTESESPLEQPMPCARWLQ